MLVAEITVAELKAMLEEQADIFILDVRELYEYQQHHLNGYLIPLAELPARMDELRPYQEKTLIVHCEHGVRSLHASHFLIKAGFLHVYSLRGGIAAWLEQTCS
ncbi:MAG: Sulfur carrier protein adenylyltransferase ThiF [Gammaproteobacteria bacterium]|nr:Sulfur carrier protein adenylyltransferase ThiF [Gammaproteobacteria bacterium]